MEEEDEREDGERKFQSFRLDIAEYWIRIFRLLLRIIIEEL